MINLNDKIDIGINVTLIDNDFYIAVKAQEILYFEKKGQFAIISLTNGKRLKSAQFYEYFKKLFSTIPSFIQTQKSIVVNTDHVKAIKPLPGNNYLLVLSNQESINLNSAYTEDFKKYFELETLEHVIPFDRPSYWLMEENISWYDKPIHLMTKEELLNNFSDQTGKPIISFLIANFLYQYAIRIRNKEAEPFEGGNVRSLWYVIKPAISKVGALSYDHYKTLSEVLARLVSHKIVTYKEYGLCEEENWVIGKTNPHIIALAEKRAHFKFITGLNEQLGVTAISTGGIPAMITMEAFSNALRKAIPKIQTITIPVITLTDYDPSGDLITSTFLEDLKLYNIRKTIFIRLVRFSPEIKALFCLLMLLNFLLIPPFTYLYTP